MHRLFAPILAPLLDVIEPKVIVETGCGSGALTRRLGAATSAVIHAIDVDPKLPPELSRALGDRLVVHRARSADAIPFAGAVDFAVLDGDPNWYTVHTDLAALAATARAAGRTPPVTAVHHMHWPYGRRDGYYDPEAVPAEHRRAFRDAGLIPGVSDPDPDGLKLVPFVAVNEFEPRSGVMTAIEAFAGGDEDAWSVLEVPGFHGVAILACGAAVSASDDLRQLLAELRDARVQTRVVRRVEAARVKAELGASRSVTAPSPGGSGEQLTSEREELRAELAAAEADQRRLQERLTALDSQQKQREEQLLGERRRIEDQLRDAASERGRLAAERDALMQRQQELARELAEARGELSASAQLLELAERERAAIQEKVGRAEHDLADQRGDAAALQATAAVDHAQREALAWRLEQVEADLTERAREAGEARQRADTEHREAVAASIRLEHTEQALADERERARELDLRVLELERQRTALEGSEAESREQARLLAGQLAHREDALDAERRDASRLASELRAMRARVETLEARDEVLAADMELVARSRSWRVARWWSRFFRRITFRGSRPESPVQAARRRLETDLPALPGPARDAAEQAESTLSSPHHGLEDPAHRRS